MKSERLGNVRKVEELYLGDVTWVKIRKSLWWPAQVADESMVNVSSKPKKKMKGEVLVRLYGSYKYLYCDPAKYWLEFEKILKENNGSYIETFQKSLEKDISNMKSRNQKKGDSETREKPEAESPKAKKAKHDQSRNIPTHSESSKSPDSLTDESRNKKTKASVNRKNKQDGAKKKNTGNQKTSVVGRQDMPKSKARAESLKTKSPKQNAVIGRSNANGPTVLLSEAVVKSPDSGTRRIKVMQSLGLVAPCGSPFLLSN
ncbi:hypothetical protein Sjap_017187 [Stephania japonica]|uniref:PWWP domain-containing protein n=1 Tax=Stephania japonica TaxID=461633 RepID=A0AAP0I5P3_9MAGN